MQGESPERHGSVKGMVRTSEGKYYDIQIFVLGDDFQLSVVDRNARHQVCSKQSIPASFINSVPDLLGGDKLMSVKAAIEQKIRDVGQITNIGGTLNIFSSNNSSSTTNANAQQIMIETRGTAADGGDESDSISEKIPPPKL